MNTDEPARTETVAAQISPADLVRLDHMAERRGVDRSQLVVQAIDALLAQEAWSGGFIPPPPPIGVPPAEQRRFRGLGRFRKV
jgi:hypothetical protein